jgi:hypothetical protein
MVPTGAPSSLGALSLFGGADAFRAPPIAATTCGCAFASDQHAAVRIGDMGENVGTTVEQSEAVTEFMARNESLFAEARSLARTSPTLRRWRETNARIK